MAKKYVVGYKVDPSEKVEEARDAIISEHQRLWSHAISKPDFVYVLDDGDIDKARAIANILKKVRRVANLKRNVFEVITDE